MNGRADVIAYLRWLADQPDGVNHRDYLFRAALLLQRDVDTPIPQEMQRHGEASI